MIMQKDNAGEKITLVKMPLQETGMYMWRQFMRVDGGYST
jgi:hypothetical protein